MTEDRILEKIKISLNGVSRSENILIDGNCISFTPYFQNKTVRIYFGGAIFYGKAEICSRSKLFEKIQKLMIKHKRYLNKIEEESDMSAFLEI